MTADPDRCCCGGDEDHGHLVGCPAVEARPRLVFLGMDLSTTPDLVWPPRLSGRRATRVVTDGLTP